ncbi:MAG: transcriptional regulator, RpiR family [Rhodobacteraceae bacterium HLUCCO18]|nr:MAG: transcriptional regulator, RpiR family [Rhodobacteraceae bacterium HLUCCO18]
MASATRTSFIARIRDATPSMHRSELRLAEAILHFPGQIASYTATELAQMAGVSNATVTRFVRKIGYASFEEARQAVRAEQAAGTALLRVDREGAPRDGQIARHLDRSHDNLERSLARLDDAEIGALVETMIGADRLWLIGFRAGQAFARYLSWQIMQVRGNVFTLPRDGETLSESLAGIGPRDCVVVFALRRPPRQFDALLSVLEESEAQTALIGDLTGLEAMPARWRLPCSTTGAGPLFDHVGVMAVCGILASSAIEGSGAAGRERLRTIENIHDSLDEL